MKQFLVLADSIGRHLRHLPGTEVLFSPGAGTRHWIKLLEDKIVSVAPDIKGVYLMMGTNDIGSNIDKTETLSNIQKILAIIRSQSQAMVFLCTVIPRLADGASPSTEVTQLNRDMKSLCRQTDMTYTKTSGAFVKRGQIEHKLYNIRYRSGRPDGIHPNYMGMRRIWHILRSSMNHHFKASGQHGDRWTVHLVRKPRL